MPNTVEYETQSKRLGNKLHSSYIGAVMDKENFTSLQQNVVTPMVKDNVEYYPISKEIDVDSIEKKVQKLDQDLKKQKEKDEKKIESQNKRIKDLEEKYNHLDQILSDAFDKYDQVNPPATKKRRTNPSADQEEL
eukprot:gb/GECH01012175.1/.p1 GENE.gb/GECH01012175.1/~~gb/GECH01012175.1/.p1  ORF type:complete len:135 (+),score=31.41 gb/GECH01012175.1/:1-405(+)